MSRYPLLPMGEFGRHLIQTGDLDPVYIVLNKVDWEEDQRLRWLVAYCAFYHCGAACWLSERKGSAFWRSMLTAAANELPTPTGERWPRGKERRHFRGQQGIKAVEAWWKKYGEMPEKMFIYVAGKGGSFQSVADRALEHRSVGSWLSFKMVDLVDACLGKKIDQSDVRPFLYETPRQSLLRYWKKHNGELGNSQKEIQAALQWGLQKLRARFKDLTIPHKPGKPIDMFCLETVACKHLSHVHGHYPLYNDIHEIHHGLGPWVRHSGAAEDFQSKVPKEKK